MKRGAARDFGAESWECVTGRVNQGESIEQALHRWMSAAAAARFLTAEDSGTIWLRRTIERAEAMRGMLPPAWAHLHASGVTLVRIDQ